MDKKIFVQALNLDSLELALIKSKLDDLCINTDIVIVQSRFRPDFLLTDLKESIINDLEDSRHLGSIDKYRAAETLTNKFTDLLLYVEQPIVKHKKLKKQKKKLKLKHSKKHKNGDN
jgi:hypothetical protein